MRKPITLLAISVALIALLFLAAKPLVGAWMMSVPETPFDDTEQPAPPDYANRDHWAALPDMEDSADWLPRGSDYKDQQANAKADVFFVHPTAAFYGDYWNAAMDNRLAILAIDFGIVPQQATAFNAAGKVYAPRYRSVRMGIWGAEDKESVAKARDLAYRDVRESFDYYMKHWNKGRPIIFASHSQGTMLLRRLLKEEFDAKPMSKQLVAAYLVGSSVPLDEFSDELPVCRSWEQSGCYVSWNTVLEGGNAQQRVVERGLTKITCVNPLSWRADLAKVGRSENHGSIPMIGPLGLGALDEHLVGARCGEIGILWIEEPPSQPGYTAALFEGGSYHTYDINLYYDSIRENALRRLDTFLAQQTSH